MDDVVNEIASGDREWIVEVVKAIDLKIGDWDFTLMLCDHFDNVRKEYEKECAEDAKRK